MAKEGSGINNNTDVVNVRVSQQSQKMANRKAWIKSAISMYTEVFETLGEDPRTMHLGLEERKLVAGQLASACMISNEIAKLRTEIGQATDDIGR
ncbi:hypothetical protein F7734_09975 [Scytonema sp. UIC 10036]|uniref:hypothetical protein n=1 Tax=Scytonema sp. UIC 10036 TaxID=2304196 RepID=UPI0012DADD33|nr:hypothetical protein [Scytonema sp. UIC 10036]MUG92759.1 hypothetical protein [Scytonema sp. UIC 10036]